MDEHAECFRMATCEPKSENQNITAYGVMLFVSGLYFIVSVNIFMLFLWFLEFTVSDLRMLCS